jgi:hypothetical protein
VLATDLLRVSFTNSTVHTPNKSFLQCACQRFIKTLPLGLINFSLAHQNQGTAQGGKVSRTAGSPGTGGDCRGDSSPAVGWRVQSDVRQLLLNPADRGCSLGRRSHSGTGYTWETRGERDGRVGGDGAQGGQDTRRCEGSQPARRCWVALGPRTWRSLPSCSVR